MIKVLQITVRSDFGGGPEHLYQLEKNINNKKFEIYTACPNQEPYYKKFKEFSKDVILIPKQTFSIKTFFKIFRFIRQKEIKIIHSHGRGAGIYSRLLKLFCSIKVVHTLHGIHYEEKLNMKNRILFFIEKTLNRVTNDIVCVSEEEKEKGVNLKLIILEKTRVISNGIDINKFKKNIKNKIKINKVYRNNLKLNKEDFVIGNISRFNYQKGIPYLLEAFSKLKIENKKLIIVGDGEDRAKIENQIKKLKIEKETLLLGFRQDVDKIIQIFDVYISTSLWEGLPISLLEVMASRIPIIATNVVGNNSIIKNNETGILCESQDITSIYRKIFEFYKLKKKYEDQAYNLVSKEYGIKKMVDSIEKLYSKY